MKIKRLISLWVVLVLLTACSNTDTPSTLVEHSHDHDHETTTENEPANVKGKPMLVDTNNQEVKVEPAKKKTLIIYFEGVEAQVSINQLLLFNEHLKDFEKNGVLIYAVSPSTPAEHLKLKNDMDLNFTFLSDMDKQFGEKYEFIQSSSNPARGIIIINPEKKQILVRNDNYMFGREIDEIMKNPLLEF